MQRLAAYCGFFWIISGVCFILFFVLEQTSFLFLGSVILIFFTVTGAIRIKYFLISIKIEAEVLKLEYFIHNEKITSAVDINSVRLKMKPLPVKGNNWKLSFYEGDKLLAWQISSGSWSSDTLRTIYKTVAEHQKRELSTDEIMTLSW